MELKYLVDNFELSGKWFKLYLYGIEIIYKAPIFQRNFSFKLYLYGIEIGKNEPIQSMFEVQIVPLWNWNEIALPNCW